MWRGNRARRDVEFLKKSKRADSRYFTIEESRETVSKRPYNPNAKRERRDIHKYKTGATYEGDWIGGFRDGVGIQIWPDGAKYDGEWKDNRAHG